MSGAARRSLFLVIAALIAQPAQAKWLRADTRNFIIYSEGNEKSLRSFAEDAERFDATLRMRFRVASDVPQVRLVIYMLPTADAVSRVAKGSVGFDVAGVYVSHPEGTFVLTNRESSSGRGPSQAQSTLFHEYAHHFMRRFSPSAFPAWFAEGFAEYFSTVEFTKEGKAQIGKPAYERAYGLLELPQVPVTAILNAKPSELDTEEAVDVYYGRSWLLTHLLYNVPTREGQLTSYIAAINRGTNADEAARSSFGDLAALDKELRSYTSKPLQYRTTNAPVAADLTMTITALPPADDALVALRLERLAADDDDMARRTKARDALIKLGAAHPESAEVQFEIAAAEWALGKDKRDLNAVRKALDAALALQPNHVRANVLLGEVLGFQADAAGDTKAATWSAVRKPIALANRTDPDDPVPLSAYYDSFALQGVRPPQIAIDGLAKAVALAPEQVGNRINYAFALANLGRHDEALALARVYAFDPHSGQSGQNLLERLERMRGGDANADASEAEEADERKVRATSD